MLLMGTRLLWHQIPTTDYHSAFSKVMTIATLGQFLQGMATSRHQLRQPEELIFTAWVHHSEPIGSVCLDLALLLPSSSSVDCFCDMDSATTMLAAVTFSGYESNIYVEVTNYDQRRTTRMLERCTR
jgi:hypothetical protein